MTSGPAPQNNDAATKYAPSVPAAVQRAAQAAEAMYRKEEETPEPEGGQPPEGTPPTEPQAQPRAEAQLPAPPPSSAPRDWERDFKAMEGRFKTEQANNRVLSTRIENLELELRALVSQPPAPPPT